MEAIAFSKQLFWGKRRALPMRTCEARPAAPAGGAACAERAGGPGDVRGGGAGSRVRGKGGAGSRVRAGAGPRPALPRSSGNHFGARGRRRPHMGAVGPARGGDIRARRGARRGSRGLSPRSVPPAPRARLCCADTP